MAIPSPANFTPTLSGYSGQNAFRFWCQKVLPLVYDDSLSYYELLNKMVVYLNNVISDVASVEGNVEALLTSYEQLQTYVNNWFNEAAPEVAYQALNRMAENGELDVLIQPFVETYVAENIDGVVADQIDGAVAGQIDGAVGDQIGDTVADQIDDVVGEQIGGAVSSQIGGAVADQIDGAVAGQIDEAVSDQIDGAVAPAVTDWLDDNVTPVGSAVVVDSSLTIEGAAADAKATGEAVKGVGIYKTLETNLSANIDEFWQAPTLKAKMKEFIIKIEPIQSGEGIPSPENVRPITGHSTVSYRVGRGNLYDGKVLWSKILYNQTGTIGDQPSYMTTETINVKGLSSLYIMVKNYNSSAQQHARSMRIAFYAEDGSTNASANKLVQASSSAILGTTVSVPEWAETMRVGCVKSDYLVIIADSYYSGTINLPAEEIALSGNFYGGYFDVISGKIYATKRCIQSYNGEELTTPWISSMDVFESLETPPTIGATVVYDLAEPVAYDVEPVEIETSEYNTLAYSYVSGGVGKMFGIKATYLEGNYLTELDIDDTLTEYDEAANAEKTGCEIDKINNLLLDGYTYKITSNDLYQQAFTGADGIDAGTSQEKRIGLKQALKVNEGATITFPNTGLYYSTWFLRTDNLFTPDVISTVDWTRTLLKLTAPEDCYVMIQIANHSTATSSTTIVPSDFTGEIVIKNNNYIDNASTNIISYAESYTDDSIDSAKDEMETYTDNKADEVIAYVNENLNAVPSYVKEESAAIAEKVRNVQTGKTLSILSVSDMHYLAQTGQGIDPNIVKNALYDMKHGINEIKGQTNIDLFGCFGDITYRLRNDTTSGISFNYGKTECLEATKILNECFENRNQFRLMGNHDTNAEANDGKFFTANQINAYLGAYSNIITRANGFEYAGIGYKDYELNKLRIITLNTSFYDDSINENTSTFPSYFKHATYYNLGREQAAWLCEILDMSDKQDAAEWQIILLSHCAIDARDSSYSYTAATRIGAYSKILKAYEDGGTYQIDPDNTVDFNGKNAAKLALNIHGHAHSYYATNVVNVTPHGAGAPTLTYNIACGSLYVPNALPDRDNPSMDGVTYTKTANSRTSTAFQVITIDPVDKIAYAHHYGAGIDVIYHYDASNGNEYNTQLSNPTWNSTVSSIATVNNGVVTPVAAGYTSIFAKSATDNCIECWNFHSEI